MKTTSKKTKRTKKTARKTVKHGNCRSLFDDLFGPVEAPEHIVLEHYEATMKELSALRSRVVVLEGNAVHERVAHVMEARAAEHRYAVATAALEQANGQIMALKAAVNAFAHSTEALGHAIQTAKIDRWQAPDVQKDQCTKSAVNECRVMDSAEPTA